jgi:hypothetical protein
MNRINYRIKPLTEASLLDGYAMSIGAIGFETRARYAYSKLLVPSARKLALRFNDRQVHDFIENESFFINKGFKISNASTESLRKEIREAASSLAANSTKERISCLVDISSMTRAHIASICYEWFAASQTYGVNVVVDFTYSHAQFSEPPAEFGPIKVRGPVISELCGWSSDPDLTTSLIIGIGFEKDIALGMTEELEPSDLVVFRPVQHDEKYSQAIDRLNQDYFDTIPPNRVIEYNVFDMYALYTRLCNAVAGLIHDTRPTLVPLGPKVFSLCCMLSGLEWMPHISVWRVSAAEFGDPINRIPSGILGFLRMELGSLCEESGR